MRNIGPDEKTRERAQATELYNERMLRQTVAALAAIDESLRLPQDGCNSTSRTLDSIRLLWAVHADDTVEIERLHAALKTANKQVEKFERGWYLRGDALEKLEQWARAYPISVFPEPDLKRAHELLTAGGISLDSVSASNMRHVIEQTKKIVEEGLKA